MLKTIEVITAGSVPKSVPIKKIRENRTKEETRTHIDFTKGVKKYATRNKIIELLPQVLSGDRLIEELGYLPAYNETIIEQSQASRLLALSDIYRVYVPSEMSIEIYNKLYLALLLSIKRNSRQQQ